MRAGGGRAAINLASLTPLFRPTSVAIIGASRDAAKIGGLPVAFMKASGFSGALYPVNPQGAEVQGLRSYARLAEIPGAVELAVVAVPAAAVLPALRDCAAKAVRAAVVFSAGFAEVGKGGRALQAEIAALAAKSGMRVLGPNCMGVVNFGTGLVASFHPAYRDGIGAAGRIGLVSQSGALSGLCFAMAADRGLAYSASASTGNEADIDVADCLAYFAEDPETSVIQLYLEGCRDGRKLMAALDLARERKKPVICLKPGGTAEGAAAVASHTAALAGSEAVFDAALRQTGAYRAQSLEEFFDIAAACAIGLLPRNERVGLVTVSGGIGVLMADSAVRAGLEVSAMPKRAQAKVQALVSFAATRNPVDITGHAVNDPTLTDKALEIVIEEGGYGSVILSVGAAGRSPTRAPQLLEVCAALRKRFPEILLCLTCLHTPEFRRKLAALACLCLEEPVHAVRAVAALARFRRTFEAPRARTPALPVPEPLPAAPIDEPAALAALAQAGIPVVPHRLARSAQEAVRAASAFGYPVVLKAVAPEIPHKTEIGGVALRLGSAAAVRRAFVEITERVRARRPEATLRGCLVAPMIEGGVEIILGIQNDAAFGPMVAMGRGGIFAEAIGRVVLRAAPFGLAEARSMIAELGSRVLGGLRGGPPADTEALARGLARLSLFAAAHRDAIASLDINPFLVLARGQGAVALDALIARR